MTDFFDSAQCALMARALTFALHRAAHALPAGPNEASEPDEATKAVMARAILEAAQHGLRSEQALANYALLHLQQTRQTAAHKARDNHAAGLVGRLTVVRPLSG